MYQLFEQERKIMEIIWNAEKPCLISDILHIDPSLSRNTVAKALVALEKKGFLKVDSIRRTVTRTGRAYVPAVTRKEYELQKKYMNSISQNHSLKRNTLNLCSTLLQTDMVDEEFVNELENIIKDYKKRKE